MSFDKNSHPVLQFIALGIISGLLIVVILFVLSIVSSVTTDADLFMDQLINSFNLEHSN